MMPYLLFLLLLLLLLLLYWQNRPLWAIAFLRIFSQIRVFLVWIRPSSFQFFWFRNNFLQKKVVSLASNPQPGVPGLCIRPPVTEWPSYSPIDRVLRLAGVRWRYSNPPPQGARPYLSSNYIQLRQQSTGLGMNILYIYWHQRIGRAIAQVASRPLPTVAAWVRSQIRLYGICDEEIDTGKSFIRSLRPSLPIIIPPPAPCSSTSSSWSGADTMAPVMSDVPSGLSLIPPHE
jgi:hypothetical protein